MRALLVSHSSTMLGGSERSLVEIAAYLVEHGDDVLVAVPEDGTLKAALESRRIRAEALPYDWAVASPGDALLRKSLSGLATLGDRVASWGPDVIMTNTSVVPWFAHVAHRLGIPHAWFLREDVTADIGIAYAPTIEETIATIAELSDAVFVNSEFLKRRYTSLLPSHQLQVFYPTFDRRLAEPAETGAESTSSGDIRLLVYGIVLPAKNQMEALEAFSRLREAGRPVTLTVLGGVGSRPYYESLTAFVEARGIGRVVTFAPHRDDPYDTVRAHDVVIVPSRAEPFGRVTVEAMALGKPVVASDSGGNSEIIGGGRDVGVLYPAGRPDRLAEAVGALLDDPGRRHQMGARARAYALDRFVLNHSLDECRTALAEVASTEKRADSDWVAGPVFEGLAREVASRRGPESADEHTTTGWRRRWRSTLARLRSGR